jgi:two-component system, cell cycle response regulator DivK
MAKILVIEDNQQNMYLCTFILNSHHHDVIQAFSGREGIESAEKKLPDLIILDIQLPEIDGYAVAREIKKNLLTSRIPIVAVTSYAMASDRERVLAAGCEGYIEKPINPATFVSEIEHYLPACGKTNG